MHGIMHDGTHSLKLYKYDPEFAQPHLYLNFPAGDTIFAPSYLSSSSMDALSAAADVIARLPQMKDTVSVKTSLFSTALTQDSSVINLIHWRTALYRNRSELSLILSDVESVGEMEIIKFYPGIVFAILDMFATSSVKTNRLSELVTPALDRAFDVLVLVLTIGVDPRFKAQITASEALLADRVSELSSDSVAELLGQKLLEIVRDTRDEGKRLRKAIKVLPLLFRTMIANSKSITSMISELLSEITKCVKTEFAMICQILMLQQLPLIVTEIHEIFSQEELLQILKQIFTANTNRVNVKSYRLTAIKALLALPSLTTYRESIFALAMRTVLNALLDLPSLAPEDEGCLYLVVDIRYLDSANVCFDLQLLSAAVGALDALVMHYDWIYFAAQSELWRDLFALLSTLLIANVTGATNEDEGIFPSNPVATVGEMSPSLMNDFSAILLSITHSMGSERYSSTLSSYLGAYGCETSSVLVSYQLEIFRRWLTTDFINRRWVSFEISMMQTIYACFPRILAHMQDICASFVKDGEPCTSSGFEGSPCALMWTDLMDTICLYIQSPSQKVDMFDYRKSQTCRTLKVDHRNELIVLLDKTRLAFQAASLPVTFMSVSPDEFFTTLIDFTTCDLSVLRVTSVDILYACIQDCLNSSGGLKELEVELIDSLHLLITRNSFEDDKFSFLFSTLDGMIIAKPDCANFDKSQSLLKALKRFVKLILAHLKLPNKDNDDFTSSLLLLIKFCKQNDYLELWYTFSNDLYKSHLNCKNFIEVCRR
jgi:hypothetical protein